MSDNDIQNEERFLAEVLDLIDTKIQELLERVDITDKDMADFHEYFWNSYTEFDEYGYELYDNTNAIRQKIVQKGDYIREKYTYERMKDSPYFGRVDFVFDGESAAVPCYIGITSLSRSAGALPVIYDWRAPVSSLFYDYDAGPASYEAPGGTIFGRIDGKYQYKIASGRIIYMLKSDINIDDDILRAELGTHASASLKAIVTTIQKEQNRIIRDTSHPVLAVQGCAGSGKTSVALHRIAYLLYHNRNTLAASQVLILSPNNVFADYISRILPELGEENICEMSLDVWAYRRLKKYGEAQDKYDRIEEILDPEGHSIYSTVECDYKQSEDYVRELDGFVLELETEGIDIKDYRYRGRRYSASYISELFYDKLWNVPFMERMGRIAEFVIDEEETIRGRDMSLEEKEYITDSLNRMYNDRDLISLYNSFLQKTGRRTLDTYKTGAETSTPQDENGDLTETYDEHAAFVYERVKREYLRCDHIPYEDTYPLLYLRYSLFAPDGERPIKHLVIDEMQDYTYLQYRLIEKVFKCAMTILGDKAQTMECECRDVLEFLPSVFGKALYTVELNKSYRSTREITQYAASLMGYDTISSIDRHGDSVGEHTFADDNELVNMLCDMIRDVSARSETIAVLCKHSRRAFEIYTLLREQTEPDSNIALLKADTSSFKTGVSVAPFYLTKGLEFDTVLIVDEEFEPAMLHKQALYIEATRALHILHVYRRR